MANAIPGLKWADFDWHYEPCGYSKPPDYLLTLRGQQFVVEITFIPHLEIIAGAPLEEESIRSAMDDVVNAAREECLSRGTLSGLYSVHFRAGIPRLRKAKAGIIARLIAYVAETQGEYDAPERLITLGDIGVCTIVKVNSQVDWMVPAHSISRVGGVPLCDIARGALQTKVQQLGKIDVPSISALPRILLLDADEWFVPPAEWRACLDNHPALSDFHSVIVVPGTQPVFAITVGNPTWPLD